MAGKCLSRIVAELFDPLAQDVLMNVEVPRRLLNTEVTLTYGSNRLELELPRKTPPPHTPPPVSS